MAVIVERGVIFEDASAIFMARILGINGVAVGQATLTSITYSVFDSDGAVVTGHDSQVVSIPSSVFDTLQTGGGWKGLSGYNFRHTIGPTAFETGSSAYTIEYKITFATGEVTWLKFEVETEGVLTS